MDLKRKVRLTITRNGILLLKTDTLRVDCSVENTIGNALNTARLDVYNLAEDTISALYDNMTTQAKVIVEVIEPARTTSTIFEGVLINLHSTPMFENHITTLWCWEEGGKVITQAPVKPIVFKMLSVKAIVEAIVAMMKNKDGSLVYPNINFDAVISEDGSPVFQKVPVYEHHKAPLASLHELLHSYGMVYTIKRKVIVVTMGLTSVGQADAIAAKLPASSKHVISPWLLAKPVTYSIGTVNIPYRLSPEISPLDYIIILDGVQSFVNVDETALRLAKNLGRLAPKTHYQILKVVHTFSAYTDDWDTAIEGFIYSNSLAR